ncbi:MAG: hypothetical protein M3Y09_08470 [Actinomycetota bacterium]|nr:hypothetical protein [Actinomycetota bacterium]
MLVYGDTLAKTVEAIGDVRVELFVSADGEFFDVFARSVTSTPTGCRATSATRWLGWRRDALSATPTESGG